MTDLTAANLTIGSPVLVTTPALAAEFRLGTLSASEGQDTAAVAGFQSGFGVVFIGDEQSDTAAFIGINATVSDLTAAGLTTESPVLVATPAFSAGSLTSTLSCTEAQDTAEFVSIVRRMLQVDEAQDTASFIATYPFGLLEATEEPDTAGFTTAYPTVTTGQAPRSLGTQPDPILVEVDAWTGSAVETLYFSTHSLTTRPTDTPANTFYDGRIKDAGKIGRTLFADGATSGPATVNLGFIELINPDGALDDFIDYGFDSRAIRIKFLPTRDTQVASATTLFLGTLAGIDSSNAFYTFRLRLRDRLTELNKPLLTSRYAGTTLSTGATAEGDEQLTGQIKPYAFGANSNVLGKLVNRFDLFYQFAANEQTSITVYDGGLALTNMGDFPALSSMLSASLSGGQYVTCLAEGIARLGATPTFAVTADIVEGTERSAARVAERMLAVQGFTTEGADELDAFNDAEVGICVPNDETILSLVSKVLDSIGAVLTTNMDGTFQLLSIDEPDVDYEDTYTLRDLVSAQTSLFTGPTSDGQGIPAWSVVVNYGRNWQVQQAGELAGAVDLARRTFLAKDDRQATSQDASVQTAHPLAPELTFDTLLTTEADAIAEAARRLDLYSTRRDRIEFPTFQERGNVELGSVVRMQMNRFGYEAGKNFIVIGREDDFSRNLITLTLWG